MKRTLQVDRDFYSDFYGDTSCNSVEEPDLDELENSITDCIEMLRYSIDHNNKEEIHFWRKMLQENKVLRRKLIA